MSPHFAFQTVPTPLGFSISPTFLGWLKWSITFSLYAMSLVPPNFHVYINVVIVTIISDLIIYASDLPFFFTKSSYSGDMLLSLAMISFNLSTV